MGRFVVKVCVLLPLTANYPCTIAFLRGNLNVGGCPDPSHEGSGSESRVLYGGKLLHFLTALVAGLVTPCSSLRSSSKQLLSKETIIYILALHF